MKIYVGVESITDEDGHIRPRIVIWHDGRRFEIQKILEERYMELGFLAPPDVIDDETKCGVIKEILDKYSPISEWDYLNFTMNMARAKGALWSAVETFAQIKKNGWTRLNHKIEHLSEPSITVLFQAYEDFCNLLKARNLVEYDDQLLMVFDLLKSDPTLFDKMGFRHIVVDEFQDTDLPQIKLLQEMINTPKFKSFLAVGDDSQAIFSFRNTSPEYLIDFFNYFGNIRCRGELPHDPDIHRAVHGLQKHCKQHRQRKADQRRKNFAFRKILSFFHL